MIVGFLFGAAHAAGGSSILMLASIAGIEYSTAYAYTRRIEAPVLAHFAVDTVQFIDFSYPYLIR